MKKLCKHCFGNQVIKTNITSNRTYQHNLPSDNTCLEAHNITPVVFMPKMHNHHLIMRKHQTNPNWRTFYKITDQNYSKYKDWKIEETKEVQQLNSICGPELDPGPKKRMLMGNWQDFYKVCRSVPLFPINVNFLILLIVL